jgi:hypothetical protein
MTRTLVNSVAATALAALAVAAGTARADDGPGLTVGNSCAVQCVKKALVSTTASSAKIEIETTVSAFVDVVVARKTTAPNGAPMISQAKSVHLYVTVGPPRTASFTDLEPDTEYSIALKATDLQGRTWKRNGTFRTLPVKTNGVGGPASIDSGLGCSVQCITKALFGQAPPDGSVATAELKTSTAAKIQLLVGADLAFHEIVFDQTNSWLVRSWKPQIRNLLPGMTYHVVVRATDAQGRVSERRGTFRTVSATALVTIQKIKIVNDGDKGKAKGELFFRYFFGGQEHGSQGFLKLGSGDVISPRIGGTSRPGVFYRLPANGDAKLQVGVTAEECDGHTYMKNCAVEMDFRDDGQYADVGDSFDLSDILSGVLPGWYGTGVAKPAGHDGYFVFGPGDRYVKILVLATVDLDYEWPS